MNSVFKVRMFWVFAFLLVAPWAMAQKDIPVYGFAGEDFSILNASQDLAVIYLGLDEVYDNDDSYYEWHLYSAPENYTEPPYGTIAPETNGGNVHKHRVNATVTLEGEYIFELVRISKYGYQKDYVVVTVRTFPVITNIEAKYDRDCYTDGDVIDINDFLIETDPPGMSGQVSLADDSKVASAPPMLPYSSQTLHFLVRSTTSESTVLSDKTYSIDVYSNDVKFALGLDPTFEKLQKKITSLNSLSNALGNKIMNCIPGPIKNKLPLQPVANIYVNPSFYVDCCNGRSTNHLVVEIIGKAGVKIDVNIPIVPAVYAGIVGEITVSPNFTLDFVSEEAFARGCEADATISLTVHGEIGGQVGVGIIKDDENTHQTPDSFETPSFGARGQVVGAFDCGLVFAAYQGQNWDFTGIQFSLIIRAVVDYGIGSFRWEYVVAQSDKLLD